MNSSWNRPDKSNWNKPYNSSLNRRDKLDCNKTENLMWNKPETSDFNKSNNVMWNKSSKSECDKTSNVIWDRSDWNKPSKKMVIVMITCIVVFVSILGVVASGAASKNQNGNSGFFRLAKGSKDNSEGTVTDYSDIENLFGEDNTMYNDSSNSQTMITGDASESSNDVTTMPTEETVESSSNPVTNEPTTKPIAIQTNAPVDITYSPTVAPTVRPTVAPTIAPTVAPTVRPTVAPTVAPTVRPTVAPTQDPYAYLANAYSKKNSSGGIVYVLANSDSRYYTAMELQSLTKQDFIDKMYQKYENALD